MSNQRLGHHTDASGARFLRKLGPHHFAYLRAVAEGLDPQASALRYLGTTHGHEHRKAHLQLIDVVRAIARRNGERAWRLVGVTIRSSSTGERARPSLEEFCAERGLDGWSEEDLQDMLEAAYPHDRRSARRDRLRLKQMDMLKRLERSDAQHPRSQDLVSDWFDEVTAKRLITAGHNTLRDLADAMAGGGVWYRSMPGIGATKAERIASHLLTLIPASKPPLKPFFALDALQDTSPSWATGVHSREPAVKSAGFLQPPALSSPPLPSSTQRPPSAFSEAPAATSGRNSHEEGRMDPGQAVVAAADVPTYSGELSPLPSSDRLPSSADRHAGRSASMLDARNDAQAVQAWIQACCTSPATVKSYTREARRLMLWLIRERYGRRFRDLTVEDCLAYQAFLQNIPPDWITRNRVTPGYLGWAPFRGPLTQTSQLQAIRIVGGLFAWLAAAKYISGNPWILVNTDSAPVDQVTQLLDTKAFSEGMLSQIHGYLSAQAPSPSVQRMQFIVSFVQAVGLRSAELINARLEWFSLQPEGWTMRVVGKGGKVRTAFVPRPAFDALQTYLAQRGLGGIESAPPHCPLISSTNDAMSPIGYQALYLTVKNWLRKAVSASELSHRERVALQGASTHWLRHTFGTRAVARDVPYDVIQQQMGHSSVSTTMNIYARAPLRRRAEELGKAFT